MADQIAVPTQRAGHLAVHSQTQPRVLTGRKRDRALAHTFAQTELPRVAVGNVLGNIGRFLTDKRKRDIVLERKARRALARKHHRLAHHFGR